jgi:Tol biopolymer transport system component
MRRIAGWSLGPFVLSMVAAVGPAYAAPSAARTVRVSVSSAGQQANADSARGGISVSGDGRLVAFASDASNLVPGDTNGVRDVFVRDLVAGTTERVSLGESGQQGNGLSMNPSITPDGAFLVFQSRASNLVAGDTNGADDIFLRDLVAGTTKLITANENGQLANGFSETPAISADGRSVAFTSSATNLVFGDHNGLPDVFVKSLSSGFVQLASMAWNGAQANNASRLPSVNSDGTIVTFMTAASNMTQQPDINGADDIFVRNIDQQTTALVSADPDGNYVEAESSTPSISADGAFVAFDSNGPILPGLVGFHVLVRDLGAATTVVADIQLDGNPASAYSVFGRLSQTGRFVAFISNSRKLVRGDTNGVIDVFVRDLQLGRTIRASVSSTGQQGNAESSSFDLPAISATGRAVAFASSASNLVPGDSNGFQDAFEHR